MKQLMLGLFILLSFVVFPLQLKAITMPCNIVLEPFDQGLTNAMGSALIY